MAEWRSWFFLRPEHCAYCPRPRHIGHLCGLHFAGGTSTDRWLALLVTPHPPRAQR